MNIESFSQEKGFTPGYALSPELEKTAGEATTDVCFADPGCRQLPVHDKGHAWTSLLKVAARMEMGDDVSDTELSRVTSACDLHGVQEDDMLKAASAAIAWARKDDPEATVTVSGREFPVNGPADLVKVATLMYKQAATCRFSDRHAAAKDMLALSRERGWVIPADTQIQLEKSAGLAEFDSQTAYQGFRLRQYTGAVIAPMEDVELLKTASSTPDDFHAACQLMETRDRMQWLNTSYGPGVPLPENAVCGSSPCERALSKMAGMAQDDRLWQEKRAKFVELVNGFGGELQAACTLDDAVHAFDKLPADARNLVSTLVD